MDPSKGLKLISNPLMSIEFWFICLHLHISPLRWRLTLPPQGCVRMVLLMHVHQVMTGAAHGAPPWGFSCISLISSNDTLTVVTEVLCCYVPFRVSLFHQMVLWHKESLSFISKPL